MNNNNPNKGDWGLGIGDWGLGDGPNPQSPIPNPQSPMIIPRTSNEREIIIIKYLISSFNAKKTFRMG